MEIETHPFEPWLPSNAKLLLLGTFPPAPKRWCMEWYYPNYTNDMWRIFGHIFFGDKQYFVDEEKKTYKLDGMLRSLPECKAVLAAGQLATKVFTEHYGIDARKMKMGDYKEFCFENRTLRLYREPSSSRAYPMKVEKKAEYYERMFRDLGILG